MRQRFRRSGERSKQELVPLPWEVVRDVADQERVVGESELLPQTPSRLPPERLGDLDTIANDPHQVWLDPFALDRGRPRLWRVGDDGVCRPIRQPLQPEPEGPLGLPGGETPSAGDDHRDPGKGTSQGGEQVCVEQPRVDDVVASGADDTHEVQGFQRNPRLVERSSAQTNTLISETKTG